MPRRCGQNDFAVIAKMRRIHLVFGLVALVAFAATGMVMRTHTPRLRVLGDDVRLMYRSRHIYLMASGMANVLLGAYLVPSRSAWRRGLQRAGSILFLGAPLLLLAAFFGETERGLQGSLWRSSFGLFALLGGTVLHFFGAELFSDSHSSDDRSSDSRSSDSRSSEIPSSSMRE
jgi:hypothetical protein